MKLFPLGIALAIAFQTSAAFADHPTQVAVHRDHTTAELQAILRQLDAIEQAVAVPEYNKRHKKHHRAYVASSDRLRQARRNIVRLRKRVYDLKHTIQQAPVVVTEPAITPMSRRTFSRFIQTLEGQRWDEGRLPIVRRRAQSKWFTSAQAARVLRTFDAPNQQLRALRLMAPQLTDDANIYAIYQAFRFPPDRHRARAILARDSGDRRPGVQVAYRVQR